jgi:transposase InsO family protein
VKRGIGTGEMVEVPQILQFAAAWVGAWLARHQARAVEYLQEENRILRAQLGGTLRLTDSERRRLARLGKEVGRRGLRGVATLATPDTILRWYRELVAKKYDGSQRRGPGRPRTAGEAAKLVVRMATENPTWGYTRIRGALANLGHEVGRNTIRRLLAGQGIEPAPERRKRSSWSTFIKAHVGAIVAADFFTVEAVSLRGLIRFHVFFVIELASRMVEIAGITSEPNGSWMEQIGRNLMDGEDGFLKGKRYLIVDRDPLYTARWQAMLKGAGVKVVKLPPRSPDLNAYAERFVLSIRSECLDRIVPLGEWHLRRAIREYLEHYHRERNHQGLENRLIEPVAEPANNNGRVRRRQRLGGMLNFYTRRAG